MKLTDFVFTLSIYVGDLGNYANPIIIKII